MEYTPRVVDEELTAALGILGAVLIEGPRACGKTATSLQQAGSSVRLDTDSGALQLAQIDPDMLLQGKAPRVIDEWQLAPQLWNSVRRAIDERQARGQFILTGSSVPADDETRHSGAGRILRLRMRPMSFFESGHSDGSVSLASILRGDPVRGAGVTLTLTEIINQLCVGGWPALQGLPVDSAQKALRAYLADVALVDVVRIDDQRRDPERVGKVLRALARNVATEVSAARLAADAGSEGDPMKASTLVAYLAALSRLMVVENQESWAPHLRSRDTVRKAPKRHFVDPSLAIAAMGTSPATLLQDLNTLGLLFESLVVRDLRVYSQSLDGVVKHYRDETGVEVDAIVELRDGSWAAFEVKLGEVKVDEGAAALLKFAAKIDTTKSGAPCALVVITTGQYAYTRQDGVHVVPLSLLGP
jgi:predicted AAA+ superfamily ATPase